MLEFPLLLLLLITYHIHDVLLPLFCSSSDREQSPNQTTHSSHGRKATQVIPDNMPPSYEEVTGRKGDTLYDEVPLEPQHRYEEVPDEANDSPVEPSRVSIYSV